LQLDPIERVSLTFCVGAVGAAYALAPTPFATGVAVGAALESVNLRTQVRAARLLFDGERAGGGRWAGAFGMRLGLMAIGILGVLKLGADPAGVVVGISLAIPAVVYWAWHNRPAVQHFEAEPALAPDDPSWDRWSVWRGGEVAGPDGDASERAVCDADCDPTRRGKSAG